jgi:hypothetical protein
MMKYLDKRMKVKQGGIDTFVSKNRAFVMFTLTYPAFAGRLGI